MDYWIDQTIARQEHHSKKTLVLHIAMVIPTTLPSASTQVHENVASG